MTIEKSIKWLGLVCILAGIARMGMTPAGLIYGGDSMQEITFAFIASILMGISSFTLYLSQSRQTGVFGFVAALLLSAGNIILASGFTDFSPMAVCLNLEPSLT